MYSVHNLTIQRDSQVICRDVTFNIQPGMCVGILGQNGCGKTTFLQTLAGLLKPHSGMLSFNDTPIHNLKISERANYVALLLQEELTLFPLLVDDMIKLGRHTQGITQHCHERFWQIVDVLQLTQLLKRNLQTLSGGEKKRVSIARILFQNPTIFLLDEPTNSLDPANQLKIFQQFIRPHQAIVFATHDVNLVEKYCDYVVLFSSENNILIGRKASLLTSENLFQVYGCEWIKVNDKIWSNVF